MLWKLTTLFVACALAEARSVGEWNSEKSEGDLGISNLSGLAEVLSQTRTWQTQSRQLAAVPARHGDSTERMITPSRSQGAEKVDSVVISDALSSTGEMPSRPNSWPGESSIGGSSAFPIGFEQIENIAEPLRVAAPDSRNPLEEFGDLSKPFSGRSPAVLPQGDPTVPAFADRGRSGFGDREDSVFNKAKATNPETRGELDKTGDESENDKVDAEQQRKDREDFEEELSDLAGRAKPYSYQDYVDYRDFVAQQGGPLGQLDLSASGFEQKAKEIFDEFQKFDVGSQNARKKELFRDFVEQEEDQAQRLIADPLPRGRKAPSH